MPMNNKGISIIYGTVLYIYSAYASFISQLSSLHLGSNRHRPLLHAGQRLESHEHAPCCLSIREGQSRLLDQGGQLSLKL